MKDHTEADLKDMGIVNVSDLDLGDEAEHVSHVIRFMLQCRNEGKLAKWNCIQNMRMNWDQFWLRQDYSHKSPGQSRECLAMQSMAVIETASFFQQSLVDMDDEWWRAGPRNPSTEESKMRVPPDIIQRITQAHLKADKANVLRHVNLGLISGILGGLIVTKITGKWRTAPVFMAERQPEGRKAKLKKAMKRYWSLDLNVVSQFNFFPDPTGRGLYEVEDMWVDRHEMMALAGLPDENGELPEGKIYDLSVCERVQARGDDDAEEKFDRMRRTNQNDVSHSFRGRIKITELWGKILDNNGNIMHDNCVATLANDRWLIRKPTPNPEWSQKSPYVTVGLLDTPDAEWPKALADAATNYNVAANELFNLMLDGAMRSVNGINQIRQDWLEDPSQIEGGIKPGTNLGVNAQCPPGAHVLEQLVTGEVPPDSLQIFNLLQQEFNRAMMTSDIRMGQTPRRDISATQVAQSQQTISAVFTGMSKCIENQWIQVILERAWELCAQFSDDMDPEELKQILGDDYDDFAKLTPEERFAETVGGIHFDVFGISLQMQKSEDFRKVMTLLQAIGASPALTEAFSKRFSFDEVLAYAMRALGLPIRQLELTKEEQEMMNGGGGGPGGGPTAPPQSLPGPGAGPAAPSAGSGSLQDQLGSGASPFGATVNFGGRPPGTGHPPGAQGAG